MTDTEEQTDAGDAAAREETLAVLVEEHGIGCPKAVRLGGPGVVDNWIEEQYDNIEKAAEAEAAEDVEDEAAAEEALDDARRRDQLEELEAREAEDAKAREGAEVTTTPHREQDARDAQAEGDEALGRFDVEQLLQDHAELIESLRARMEDQESQGIDQWRAIEANTAGRIELGKAVEKRQQPRRPSEGKPRSRSKGGKK